jgi:hypothetical protein
MYSETPAKADGRIDQLTYSRRYGAVGARANIFSKSLYKQMRKSGFSKNEVLTVCANLIGFITTDIKDKAQTSRSVDGNTGTNCD